MCSPSRTSLLTGARPDTTKVGDLVTHFRGALPNVVTLPEHCKQNGYFVQGMGKLFHPSVEDPQSWSVPRQTPKAVNYALSDPEDVHPTLADVAGLLLPQHLEGVSFKPVLVDPKRKWKPTVFSQYPRGQRLMGYSMRTERYRFPV